MLELFKILYNDKEIISRTFKCFGNFQAFGADRTNRLPGSRLSAPLLVGTPRRDVKQNDVAKYLSNGSYGVIGRGDGVRGPENSGVLGLS